MGTIKGQNLRVLVNDRCVAASLSCVAHIAVQLSETSTKDTEGSWQEQEPVEKTWDGSVEALITDGIYDAATGVPTTTVVTAGIYESSRSFKLKPGQVIHVSAASGVKVSMNDSHGSPLVEMLGNTAEYTNNGSATMFIYLLSDTDGATLDVYITDNERCTCNELLTAFFAGQPVGIRFSVTGGRNNIVESEALLEGEAYINDLQLTAQNKQIGQFTMSFTGTGELERVEE